MKILFVSHEKNRNGSTISMISLIMMLICEYKCEIHVLLPGHGEVEKELVKYNISYEIMDYQPNFRKIGAKEPIMECIKELINKIAVSKINEIISKGNYDIVCSNSTAVDVGARAAKFAKVPHIYYVREFMERDYGIEYRNKKRMKSLLENSECIIFISKSVEQYYTAKYKLKNTFQFYNGFIIEEYYIQHDILNEEKLSLIQAGNYQDGKGTINTIQMLHLLNNSGFTEWKMEFVGRGTEDYIRKMHALISKYKLESQITISGFFVNMKEKLSGKDILIMNSKSEGFGRVTVEGMLTGCLVIGRNSGGTAEIIIDKVNGLLFENEANFVNIIKEIYANRDTYRKLAKSGQKYAAEKFDCVNTAQNFMTIIYNICSKNKIYDWNE